LKKKKLFLPKKTAIKVKVLNLIVLDKKSIIFDLDETLIHCNESTNIPADIILPIKFPTGEIIEVIR
jgi:CTD small phosphatase-like protein 2